MKFCAKCGKKGETVEGLCKECYSRLHPTIDTSKEIVIGICEGCNRAFHRNRWSRYPSLEEAVKNIVKENIKTKAEIEVTRIKEDRVEVEIKVIKTGEEFFLPIKIKTKLCDGCRKNRKEYFEGVLQLRGIDEDVVNWVFRDIEKRKKYGVFVQDVVELKNGLDISLTSQKYLQALGAKLKKKFKGTVKTTRKLFTRNKQTSKPVYRLTLLYKQEDKES